MDSPNSTRHPGTWEKAASAAVLFVLVATLAWLMLAQARFSPAVTIALDAAQAARAVPPPETPAPTDVLVAWPAGLRPMSATETFSPETLSDKIDGRAEVYLAAGFTDMKCQRVGCTDAPDTWLEIFVYDMGAPANAFSVYSSQKRPGVVDARIGDYSYTAGNQLCVVHGRFYIEVIATDAALATTNAADALARRLLAATPVAEHANVSREQALFPIEGLVAGSIELQSADVFGFDQLQNVFVGRYREGADDFTLFVATRGTADEAAATAAALRRFLVKDCGGREISPPAGVAGAVVVDLGGLFDGVFSAGPLTAGVHQAPSAESAARWLEKLAQHLRTRRP